VRRRCRHRGPAESARDVGADGIADFVESHAVAGVDAVKVADAMVRHVGHFGEAAFHTAIVAVINEAVMDTRVVAEAVSRL
jgi:tryptophan synthase alpha subunit